MFFFEQFLHLSIFDWLAIAAMIVNLAFIGTFLKFGRKFSWWKHRPWLLNLTAGLLILPTLLTFYTFFIEPNWLVTKTYQVDASQVTLSTPLKIVVIGDLQAKAYFTPSYVPYLAKRVNELNPDYVVWVGDLLESGNLGDRPYFEPLGQIQARSGKIAVLGNHDYRVQSTRPLDSSISDGVETILSEAGFTVLRNEVVTTNTNGVNITWAGTEDLWTNQIDFETLNAEVEAKGHGLNLLVTHQPLAVQRNENPELYVLTMAGHCHGGQVSLGFLDPLLGLPWVPPGCPDDHERVSGLITENRHQIMLTPGVGSLGLRTRLLMRPEISVVELY